MIAYKAKGGARSERDEARVAKLLEHFGPDKKLPEIGQEALAGAYEACLRDGADTGPGGKLRGVFAPLHAVMEAAALHRLCDRPRMKAPTPDPAPTVWMKPAEVAALIAAAPKHAKPLFVTLFGIGPRASEIIDLEWPDVDLRGKRARLIQKQKRSRPERNAALPPVVVAALESLPHRTGAVFRPDKPGERAVPAGEWQGYRRTRGEGGDGSGDGGQFKKLWATACLRAGLPGEWREWTSAKGKRMRRFVPRYSPHDARHTWATWTYCINKDLLGLRDEGGWATTMMVERYAKVMPEEYRQEAVNWFAGRPLGTPPDGRRRPGRAPKG